MAKRSTQGSWMFTFLLLRRKVHQCLQRYETVKQFILNVRIFILHSLGFMADFRNDNSTNFSEEEKIGVENLKKSPSQ